MLKNIIIISLAFMLQFTAFLGIANLQSSINEKDGLGTISLCAIYGSLVISCIFLPALIIPKLTTKWTQALTMLCYAPYIVLQLFPRFYTLVPAGVLVGLSAPPMFASMAIYLTEVARAYSIITEKPAHAVTVRSSNFFFLTWQSAHLWGNLISSLFISGSVYDEGSSNNDTITEKDLQYCGANFCVHSHNNVERPPDHEILNITIIYLSCIIAAAAIIAFFLDPLKRYGVEIKNSKEHQELSRMKLLRATFRQMRRRKQQLLIPITIFIGMEQVFIGADFTQAYVSCAFDVHQIGIAMLCAGIVNIICSILFGSLKKYIGLIPIIAFGAVVHFTLITAELFWQPNPDYPLMLYVMSGLWGVGDAVWQTQINDIYGMIFRHNIQAAFSNYRLWESIGFVVALSYAHKLCAHTKLYILLVMLTLGCIGYAVVEVMHRKKQKTETVFSLSDRWRVMKNIGIISLAFMIQFTAFQGTANLQSSINTKNGLGTISLSAIYASLVVSCIFLPTLIIQKITVKWTLVFSMLCYAPYIGFQLFPRFYTLVPAGILVGLGAAPMWASMATYLTYVSQVYAKVTKQYVDAIIVRFFGYFFLAWQTAELWGNLISSLVLSSGAHGGGGSSQNGTITEEELEYCGANFCVDEGSGHNNMERPPDHEILEISMIYLSCIISAAAIIALFLDPMKTYQSKNVVGSQEHVELSGMELLWATIRQMKRRKQQLLIPITIFIGMEQAFIGADFTQAFVSCALGIHQIGFVMICFGVVDAICSIVFGSLMKYIGRVPIIALGAILHFTLITVELFWRPNPDNVIIFFVMSGLWGAADAVWQTQINGLYGLLFRHNKEPAFSNYRLWESAGFVLAYAYDTQLCTRMKLYILLAVLLLGCIGYVIVEIMYRRMLRRYKITNSKSEETAIQQEIL